MENKARSYLQLPPEVPYKDNTDALKIEQNNASSLADLEWQHKKIAKAIRNQHANSISMQESNTSLP